MKVIDKRVKNSPIRFEDLPLGQVYYDENGGLNIKISTDPYADINTLFYDEPSGSWTEECESMSARVVCAKATLTIEG